MPAIETRSGPDFDRSGFFANSLTTELHGSHGVFLPATGFEVAIVNIYTFPTCFPCSGIFTFGASSTAPTLVATKADDQPDSRTVSGVLTLTAGLQASDSPQLVRLAQIRTQVYTLSSPIPEPATAALCVAGLLLLGLRGRLRKRR